MTPPKDELVHGALLGGMSKRDARSLGLLLWRYGWRAGIAVVLVWQFGGFERYGLGAGMAFADDVKELDKSVDERISEAVKPLRKELLEQRRILDQVARNQTEQFANSVATEIRYLVGKRCSEPVGSSERDRLQREIDRKQDEYAEYKKGKRYEYGCADL